MAASPSQSHGNHVLFTVIGVAVVLVAIVLVAQSMSTQTSLQNGRKAGTQQRTDEQQVSCALWAALRATNNAVPASAAAAASRVCASLPTPLPTTK